MVLTDDTGSCSRIYSLSDFVVRKENGGKASGEKSRYSLFRQTDQGKHHNICNKHVAVEKMGKTNSVRSKGLYILFSSRGSRSS